MYLELIYNKNGLGAPLSLTFLADLKRLSGADSFIETGTYFGDTVDSVRGVFKNVCSIELSPELFAKAQKRFHGVDGVRLLNGNSASMLGEALTSAGKSTSILWLDAHYSGEGTSRSASNTPIVSELEAIERFGNGSELIMIDDVRMFGKIGQGFLAHDALGGYPELRDVCKMIRGIGGGYDCFVVADILLALPVALRGKYTVSAVLSAVTDLRLAQCDASRVAVLERAVAGATGVEGETILALPEIFQEQLLYGLGGDFCYWRSLLHAANGRVSEAKADMALYLRCSGSE